MSEQPHPPRPGLTEDAAAVSGDISGVELIRGLDLLEERRALRRVETLIFVRGMIILALVIGFVILRGQLL